MFVEKEKITELEYGGINPRTYSYMSEEYVDRINDLLCLCEGHKSLLDSGWRYYPVFSGNGALCVQYIFFMKKTGGSSDKNRFLWLKIDSKRNASLRCTFRPYQGATSADLFAEEASAAANVLKFMKANFDKCVSVFYESQLSV